MKVVVANPPWPGGGFGARTNVRWPHKRGDKHLAFPIYLSYATAVLKKEGFNVRGVDAVQKEWGIWKFADELKKFSPDVVMLEVSTPSIMYDLEMAHQIRNVLPNATIVLCGPHATYFAKQIIDGYSFVDACVHGEFDHTIRDICRAKNAGKTLNDIDGITWRNSRGKTVTNNSRKPIDNLDELPLPDREDFKIEDYQQAFYAGKKTGLMISSRGCPFQCTFCLWPEILFGHKFRQRSPKSVVDEIEHMIRMYGIDEIFFDDDTFVLNDTRVRGICEELLRRKIKIAWHCMGRVNTVNQDTLNIMKKAGCTQIFYGLESGSDKILEASKKGITKKEMVNAVNMTQRAGLVASGSFIFGLPDENRKTVKETMDFAKKLHADYVQFTLAAPFPGTKLFEEVSKEGLLEIDSWADLDGCHGPILRTRHLSKDELAGIQRDAYVKYYTHTGVIWQNIKKMRTIDDIRRILRGALSIFSRIFYYRK